MYAVVFESLNDLMTILKTAEISGSSKRRIKYLRKVAQVVVDEVGFMPPMPGAAGLFFSFVSAMAKKILPLTWAFLDELTWRCYYYNGYSGPTYPPL